MIGNKQAYDEAYQRAVDGRSASLWSRVTGAFEDEYTRRSRERGEQDGSAARAAAEQGRGSGTEAGPLA